MIAEPAGFRELVVARSPALLRTAWMLTGDAASAEDLLQSALARVWPRWSRIADGRPEAYVRTAMVRINASWRSRRWNGETPTADMTRHESGGGVPNAHAQVDDRMILATGATSVLMRASSGVSWKAVIAYVHTQRVPWEVNARGQTYGVENTQGSPDLVAVVATNGRRGYAYKTQLQSPMPASPSQALQWQREHRGDRSIPVYEHDGVTRIGVFHIG